MRAYMGKMPTTLYRLMYEGKVPVGIFFLQIGTLLKMR